MADPILDELWRVREMLLKKHGGFEGFLKYVRKLERAQHRRNVRSHVSKERKRGTPKTPTPNGSAEAAPVMRADPILDRIAAARESLVKEHGGWEGYFKYIQKLDRARQRREKRARASKKRRRTAT